jgi:hypothetical protein
MVSDGGRVGTDYAGNRVLTTTSRYQSSTGSSYEDRLVVCDVCGGARYMCPACGNTGGGGGKAQCPDCGGSGTGTCKVCNGSGTGTCTYCHGQGIAQCVRCGGECQTRTVEGDRHEYKRYWMDKFLPGDQVVVGAGVLFNEDESLVKVTESNVDSVRVIEPTDRFAGLIETARKEHRLWSEQNEGKLLFRSGWRLGARVITYGTVNTTVDEGPRKGTNATWIAATGTTRCWRLWSDEGGAIVAWDKVAEFAHLPGRHKRSQGILRKAVMAALVVEAVVFAVLILGALGVVPIM